MLNPVIETNEEIILIVDKFTEQIIKFLLMEIKETFFITIQMLELTRQPFPAASAVYFIHNSNVQKAINDFTTSRKYAKAYFYFLYEPTQELKKTIKYSPLNNTILNNLNSSFVIYNDFCFTLLQDLINIDNSWISKQFSCVLDQITDLMSCRFFKDDENCAEIAHLIANMVTDLNQKSILPCNFLIVPRKIDLNAALIHDFNYEAISNDLLGNPYNENDDKIWQTVKNLHIGDAIDFITTSINDLGSINAKKEGASTADQINNLVKQMSELPEWQENKKKLGVQTETCQLLMSEIKEFKIQELSLLEQIIVTGFEADGTLAKDIFSRVMTMLSDTVIR